MLEVVEILAVIGNLAYTVLMLLEKRVGWLFGIVASALGVWLFWEQEVFAQVGLNAFPMWPWAPTAGGTGAGW